LTHDQIPCNNPASFHIRAPTPSTEDANMMDTCFAPPQRADRQTLAGQIDAVNIRPVLNSSFVCSGDAPS